MNVYQQQIARRAMMQQIHAKALLPLQVSPARSTHDKVLRERRSQAQARREYQQAVDDGLFF